MNYVEEVIEDLRKHPTMNGCDTELLKQYALLVLVRGERTTERDVHDAWSIWITSQSPDHPSLIPFHELSDLKKNLDVPYMEAIHEVSRIL